MHFKKQLCARILSEANDLKRTTQALAQDLNMDFVKLQTILSAEVELSEIYDLINKMGDYYAIDKADLLLAQDDCVHGVKICRAEQSKQSSRITLRPDRHGERTPYYEYRDTAMSCLAPYKPEWIKELRTVNDADPFNPDAIYNNGHFMHQTTFFIGPVNFYWEVNGQRFCKEMNTGDSNYITPYWKHSFTCRDASKEALILAVTFGGSVRHSQKEFYALQERAKALYLDVRNPNRAISQLIAQHMNNENISIENLNTRLSTLSSGLKATDFLDEEREKHAEDLQQLAKILHVELSDLMIPAYRSAEEVVVTHRSESVSYIYPNEATPHYRIYQLARATKMPQMKSFDIEVLSSVTSLQDAFNSSLHTYVYNYGDSPCRLLWSENGQSYQEVIYPGDSFYLQPLISHAFQFLDKPSRLYMVRIAGTINLATQKEVSYFADMDRVVAENVCWFN